MNEEQALEIAVAFLLKTRKRTLKLIGAKRSSLGKHEWDLLFDLSETPGSVTDGPLIVIVDETTREARYF